MEEIRQDELVIVMKDFEHVGFDFVGRFSGMDNDFVYLRKAAALDYSQDGHVERIAPLHLPPDFVDFSKPAITALPKNRIAYMSAVPSEGDDWLHQEYARQIENWSE